MTILANNPARNLITKFCRQDNINYIFEKKGNVNVIHLPQTFKTETILREVRLRLGPNAFKLKTEKP
jgi:hypothetical protein